MKIFQNSGSKLKIIALVLFFLVGISGTIGGIVILTELDAFASLGITLLIFSFPAAYLSALPLYGLGDGIESAKNAETNTDLILMRLQNTELQKTQKDQNERPKPFSTSQEAPARRNFSDLPKGIANRNWICIKCGAENAEEATECARCSNQREIEKKPLKDHLHTALSFLAVDEMRRYLVRVRFHLEPAEREELDRLLTEPNSSLRAKIQDHYFGNS